MNNFKHDSFSFSLLLIALTCFDPITALAQRSGPPEVNLSHAGLIVSVTDEQGKAIDDVDICVFQWTGKMEPYPQSQATCKEGRFCFTNLDIRKMFYLRVMANGFASSMQSLLSLTAGEVREIQFKMSKPAKGWINVVTPDGMPIEGARISTLEYVDVNKNSVYLSPEMQDSLAFQFTPSDVNGRLELPPLPKSFKCSVTIVHANWRVGKVNEVAAFDERLSTLVLRPGVKIHCELKQIAGDTANLDGKLVRVKMISMTRSKTDPADVRIAFPVVGNRISFTACPVEYAQLSLEMDSHFLGPNLSNYPDSTNPELDLSAVTSKELEFRVQTKVKVKGRLVDSNGEGVTDASIYCSVAPNETAIWPSDAKPEDRLAMARQWTNAGNAESDANGNYEVDLVYGKATLEVIRDGFFSDPNILEFVVPKDRDFTISDLILYPVPKLRGRIVNEDGSSVAGAYARMRHSGYGDADPVCEADEDGLFTLIPSRIPYSSDLGLQTTVSVVALDAKTGKAGTAEVNLKDAVSCENISIQLSPRPVSWLMDVVKQYKSDDPNAKEAKQKYLQGALKEFSRGTVGSLVPSLREGTWLNTEARSLEDFQGKIVLLDFWFIGCGPCHRDMASVRIVHRQLSEFGFSVVSVHKEGESPKDVQIFADKNGMNYPIVVDDSEGTITKQFRDIGLDGFPTYILLDRDGRILHNDAVGEGASLRSFKFEKVYEAVRSR